MPNYLQRKYIDLIHQACSKWVNWDPPIEIKVGTYGTVDKETGELIAEGNIYDPEFQEELFKHNGGIRMLDYPPAEGSVEEEFAIASRGVKAEEVDKTAGTPAGANVFSMKKWSFERGKRGAVLVLHKPRQIFIPKYVALEPLYKVDKLIDKWLVTNVFVCPAYSMYLSDKSGDKVSFALVSKGPLTTAGVEGTNGESTWWVDAPHEGVLRRASDATGTSPFTPLYTLKRPIRRNRRFFRDAIRPEPAGDDLWYEDSPPWDPLDDDGVEDPFDPEVYEVDPFAAVNKAAEERAAKERAEEEAREKRAAILRASGAPF